MRKIYIGGRDISASILTASFRRSIQEFTGAFAFTIIPTHERKLGTATLVGEEITAYIDGRLIFTGWVETRTENHSSADHEISFAGRGKMADVIDSYPRPDFTLNAQLGQPGNLIADINKLLNSSLPDGEEEQMLAVWKTSTKEKPPDPVITAYEPAWEAPIERNIRSLTRGITGLHLFEGPEGDLYIWRESLTNAANQKPVLEIDEQKPIAIQATTSTARLHHEYQFIINADVGAISDFDKFKTIPFSEISELSGRSWLPKEIRATRQWRKNLPSVVDEDGANREAKNELQRRFAAAEVFTITLPSLTAQYEIGDIANFYGNPMCIMHTEHKITDSSAGHATIIGLCHIPALNDSRPHTE